jgi:hypothetical protein
MTSPDELPEAAKASKPRDIDRSAPIHQQISDGIGEVIGEWYLRRGAQTRVRRRRALRLLLACVLLLSGTGCTRSDADIARQRDVLRAALAEAPLPAGAQLDLADAQFDAGCRGFAECIDGDESPAVYAAPLRLDPVAGSDPAGWCRYFLAALRRHDLRLVSVWRGTRASHATTPTLPPHHGNIVRPRWIDVTDDACATGHVHTAVIVDPGGASPAPTAHLVLSLSNQDDTPAPRYLAIADALGRGRNPADRVVSRLPVGTPPLTHSELSYLRARLDRPFVIAADPPTDGIGTDDHTTDTWTVQPRVGALRFQVTCSVGDTVRVGVSDAAASTVPRGSTRTEDCTGGRLDIPLAVPAPVIVIDVTVRQRPPAGTPIAGSRHDRYTVQVMLR